MNPTFTPWPGHAASSARHRSRRLECDPEDGRFRPVEVEPATPPGVLPVGRQEAGGAEIELSLLFADVRGSTSLAEHMQPQEVSRLISRFYGTAAQTRWVGALVLAA